MYEMWEYRRKIVEGSTKNLQSDISQTMERISSKIIDWSRLIFFCNDDENDYFGPGELLQLLALLTYVSECSLSRLYGIIIKDGIEQTMVGCFSVDIILSCHKRLV